VRRAANLETYYLGKKVLSKPPLGVLFRWLGGYPVDRSSHHNLVDTIVKIFDSHETFAISIAPEGTRKKVTSLKTGFYYIARKAQIPIILTKFDAGNKIISFSEPFYPTSDDERDLRFIEQYFSGVVGIRPEKSFYADE
jgi:1-acyl-sn-glycerol-3-phosphate acyltransferase